MRWKLTVHYKDRPSEISYFQEGTHTVFVKLDLVEDDAIKFELEKEDDMEDPSARL